MGSIRGLVRWCTQNPRIAISSATSLLLLLIATAISTWAWLATSSQAAVITQQKREVERERDEADRQRDEARRLATIANDRKAVAEENAELAVRQANLALQNLQYLITDVDGKLRERPGVDALRIELLESVIEKWDQLEIELVGGIRGEAIPTLMATRQSLANTLTELEQLDAAGAEYEKLEQIARERVALKDGNDATRTNLAKILNTSGLLARRISSPADGIAKLEEACRLTQDVLENPKPLPGSPSPTEVRRLHAAVNQNLAVQFLREGRVSDARARFQTALDANENAMELIRNTDDFGSLNEDQRDGRTAGLQIQIDKSRLALAYAMLRLGNQEDAFDAYDRVLVARREIYDRRPTHPAMMRELAGCLKIFGKSLLWTKQTEAAGPPLQESLSISEALLEQDDKPAIKRQVVESLLLVGKQKIASGEVEVASDLFNDAKRLARELFQLADDRKNRALLMLACSHAGDSEQAKNHADTLGETELEDSEIHIERARAYGLLVQKALSESVSARDEATGSASRSANSDREIDRDMAAELTEAAYAALSRAIDEGFADPFRIQVESEFDAIRHSERFAHILERVQAPKNE
ncbi:MAG: hypothetical protein AAGG44_06340 [Planctomycetota bacterium]